MSDNVENELFDKGRAKDVNQYTTEIHQLKKALVENNSQLVVMETACLRNVELEDSLIAWQDKYERLHESHKRVQRINESLEDKLLKLVDRSASERAQLTSDVAALGVRLAQANYNIGTLQREIERYKTDMSLAIQLLQCKPDNFISQKVNSLPHEIQSKLTEYIRVESHSDSEGSTSGIATATDNAYQVIPSSDSPLSSLQLSSSMSTSTPLVHNNGLSSTAKNQMHMRNNDDGEQLISPLGMAKYLEDKLKSTNLRHCETCQCSNRDLRVLADIDQTYSIGTQTMIQGDILNSVLCLRCNNILNSPGSNHTPFNMFISCDSIVSDAKSTSNSLGDDSFEKLPLTTTKRDELMVNPILGHTPISDRTIKKILQAPASSSSMTSLSVTSTTIGSTSTSAVILTTSLNQTNEENSLSSGIQPNLSSKTFNANTTNEMKKYRNTDRSTNQQQRNRTLASSSSSSLSNRRSVNVDGPKLFENFNRNLIKSIKVGKPNVTGPRLCAVRIPTDSGNVLIDNIESDAMPVIYTRRNRPLDDELNEKNTITTHESAGSVGNTGGERTFHRISMLMTDGAVNTKVSTIMTQKTTTTTTTTATPLSTVTSSMENKNQVLKLETQHNSIISDSTQSQLDTNYSNAKLIDITDDDNNTTKCMEQIHTMTTITAAQQFAHQIDTQTMNGNGLDLESKLDKFCSTNTMSTAAFATLDTNQKQILNNDEIISMGGGDVDTDPNGADDQKQYQFIHMHQFGQQQQSLTDDTLALKRQQLNRVAEWVKSNSDLEETNRNTNVSMNTTTMGSTMGDETVMMTSATTIKQPFSKQINKQFQINETINVHHSSVDRNPKSLQTPALMLKHCNQSNLNNNNCNLNVNNTEVNVNGTGTGTETGTMINHTNSHTLNNNNRMNINCEYDEICLPSALSDINHMENEQNHSIIDYGQMEYNVKQFLLRPCRYDN